MGESGWAAGVALCTVWGPAGIWCRKSEWSNGAGSARTFIFVEKLEKKTLLFFHCSKLTMVRPAAEPWEKRDRYVEHHAKPRRAEAL